MNYKTILNFLLFTAVFSICPLSYSAEKAEDLAEVSAGFYYTVKEGDTLWDLSQRFSDSYWLWPDLWHYNTQITNPHLIYPGQKIRLFQKDWKDKIPEQTTTEAEVAEAPPSQPTPYFFYPPINSVGFIRKEPVSSSGIIFKVKDDKEMISKGDVVYLKPTESHPFSTGSEYTVYRTIGPIMTENQKDPIGTQYYFTGIVRITETHPDYALADVTQSFRSIDIGDRVIPYSPKSSQIPLSPNVKGLEGSIIRSEENSEIIGDNTIAFIDKGTMDGVQSGQMYSIYYQEKERLDPKKKVQTQLPPVDFGRLIVLHTEDTTSTVYITSSKKEIVPDAKIHGR